MANWLYGAAKIGTTGTSVRLARRVQDIIGEDAPAWTALRQGLWARLAPSTEGVTRWGLAASQTASEFLNGSGTPLAPADFSLLAARAAVGGTAC
jgi:hypothetical protein